MEVDSVHPFSQEAKLSIELVQIQAWREEMDTGRLDQRELERVEGSRADEQHIPWIYWCESGDCRRQVGPAPPGEDSERHSVQKTAGGGFGCVEVRVRVEPDRSDPLATQARDHARAEKAAPQEDEREPTLPDRRANQPRHFPGDGEARRDLRGNRTGTSTRECSTS